MHQRVLAIDYGRRRWGLAVSDELGFTAQGLPTLVRTNKRRDFQQLARWIEEKNAGVIVVGYPLHLSGDRSASSEEVEEFAAELRKRLGVEAVLWDERLTSREAERVLREAGAQPRRKKGAVDRMAAVLILQSYLDSQPADEPASDPEWA